MEVVVPSRIPSELRQAALAPPPEPAETDEAGRTLVPEAPQMQQAYYEAADGMDALDPELVTENRAPRGAPAGAVSAPEVLAAAESQLRGTPATKKPGLTLPRVPDPEKMDPAPQGSYAVHLASYRRASKARQGWVIYTAQYGELLTSLSPRGSTVDIPGKGAFIRLLAGPFPSSEAAQSVCDELAHSEQYCRVVPFEGAPLL